MSMQNAAQQGLTPIYQCDSELHHALLSVHDHLHGLCASHTNRLVKVETIHGECFEGHILHCDRGILHLSLSNEGYNRAFLPGAPNPYYNNAVLPLVLFNLLAITLL